MRAPRRGHYGARCDTFGNRVTDADILVYSNRRGFRRGCYRVRTGAGT